MPPSEDFLPCFPANVTQAPGSTGRERVLVDGTPDYLFNSVAAPRIRAVVPQARFVIILRVRGTSTGECAALHSLLACCYPHLWLQHTKC